MKKSASTGAISGCVLWVIVFAVLSACLLPVSTMVGGFTSASSLAARVVGGWNARKAPHRKSTLMRRPPDDYGFPTPATAYELHCVNANGEVIKNDPVGFAFIWEGIAAGTG